VTSRPRGPVAFVVALGLFVAASACRSADREGDRVEAGQIVHAIRTVRRAPHDQKAPALELLEGTSCRADRCAVKERCVAAYRAHVEGERQLARARDALSASDAPIAGAAPGLLGEAQKHLEQAVVLAKQCADLEAELARAYRLE
jgi:hypothetical protein